MSQELEIELKNMLTNDEFDRLVAAFELEKNDFREQTNYYIDTSSFALKSAGVALRIREKNGSYELTLKEPHGDGLLETTDLIKSQKDFIPFSSDSEVSGQLKKFKIEFNDLHVFGSLRTVRAEIDYEGGLLVFDKSLYFDKVDYELEYEVPELENGKKQFMDLLQQHSIPMRTSMNKIERFYEEKIRLDSI